MNYAQAILRICHEIETLESEADRVMRSAMSTLFRDKPDTRERICLKAVYELLKMITDRCADMTHVIEGIVRVARASGRTDGRRAWRRKYGGVS